jgi:RNA 3'-terminal phosphate cyclase
MPNILESGTEHVRRQVEAAPREQLEIEATNKDIEVSISKDLGKGWSVSAWARAQYEKLSATEYGAKLTKTWGARRFKS